jgi:putative spermidine/putrescine transport system permease protein
LLVLPAVAFLLVFYAFPLVRLLLVSVEAPRWSLTHYADFFTEPAYLRILTRTFRVSLTVTACCLILGYPTAYVLSRVGGRGRRFLLLLVIVPYLTSFLVRTYAWMVLLGPKGVINSLLLKAGLIDAPLKLLYSAVGVHVGMVHVLLPLMILPLYSVMVGIDRSLPRAAQTLGAGPLRTFFRVFLPLSLPGVRSGCVLVFLIALGFYITPAMLGGLRDSMIAMLIESQITQLVNWGFAATAAVVLLAVTLGGFSLVGRVSGMSLLVASEASGETLSAVTRGGAAGGGPRRSRPWMPRLVRLASVSALGRRLDAVASAWRRRRWAALQGREALGEGRGRAALDLYAGAVFFFLILPTFVVVPISLSAGDFLAFPPPGWSLKWYTSYFSQPAWLHATLLSFQVAVVTTLASTVLGTLAAFGVLRGRLRRRSLVVSLIISPIIVPPIVIGVAIYGLLAQWDLIGRFLGLVIGHAIGSIAYVMVIVSATLAGFDRSLERAAMSLGAGPLLTFRRVTFPLIRAGVLSGAVFAFIHSFDEVIITMFISGVHVQTLPLKMWEDIRNQIDPTIAAVSSMLILLPVAWLVVLEVTGGLNRATAPARPADHPSDLSAASP